MKLTSKKNVVIKHAQKTLNYAGLFLVFCNGSRSNCEHVFYHTEISWLSFIKYFKRFSNLEPGYPVFYHKIGVANSQFLRHVAASGLLAGRYF